jgi:hypothetical protein|tara:strand:- start:502 stop:879 length:378 start_codon:yes stop_codon:yes gene_type:complete
MQNPNKVCELCSEEFTPKRTDARFCGRKCQYTSNNRSKAKAKAYLKSDLPRLESCRNILHTIFIDDSVPNDSVPVSLLTEKQFQFGVYTSYFKNTETNQTASRLFDYVIEPVGNELYQIYIYEES